jgi:hypothetical protein
MGNITSICGSPSIVADALELTPRVATEGSRAPQRSEAGSHPLQTALPSRKDGTGVQGAYSRLRQQVDATKRSNEATKNANVGKADALYQTHNIIGSTGGGTGQRPTVYYRTNSGTLGRITQEHHHPDNIGRALPRKSPGYSQGNTGPGGVAQEKIGAKVIHTSRHPFVPATTDAEREALSQAHENFPHFKKWIER